MGLVGSDGKSAGLTPNWADLTQKVNAGPTKAKQLTQMHNQ
jgi:hypothetical protein